MAGCWRKNEAHDPDTFAVAMTAVFTCYSPDVVQYVCDPRVGLPKTHKWAPEIAEVHAACLERVAYLARIKRLKNWQSDPDAGEERERQKDLGRLPPPPEIRPTRGDLEAKHGPNWGMSAMVPSDMQLRDFCKTLKPGTTLSRKEMIEGWRIWREAAQGGELIEGSEGGEFKALQGQALVDHYAAHDLENFPKGTRVARPLDPAMAAVDDKPAPPIIGIDGTELDQGANF